MSEITTITTKVRNLLGDIAKRGSDVFVYGNSPVFTLTEENVENITTVYVGDTELASGDFSYDTETNKLTLLNSGNISGDIIEIIYSYYPNYSNTYIEAYISASMTHLSTSYDVFWEESGEIYPDPTPKEQNLIALVASLLIDPKNISYKLPDLWVQVPKDTPISQKINAIVASFKMSEEAGAGVWGIL